VFLHVFFAKLFLVMLCFGAHLTKSDFGLT